MGMYFEQFEVGEKITTASRTVLESDILTFATLTGDHNRLHTDAEFSKTGPFGQQVAHGLLGLSFTLGLAWQTGILDGTVLAFREIDQCKFIKPVFIGDTVHAVLNIIEAKALPRIGGGSILLAAELKNQKDEVCLRGNLNVLVMSKPKTA